MGAEGGISAQPSAAHIEGKGACVLSPDRTQRRIRTVRRQSNTVRGFGTATLRQLNYKNTQCGWVETSSVPRPVKGNAYHR